MGIPVKVNIDSGGKPNAIPVDEQELFVFPLESVFTFTGMLFGFRPESRSPSTGFPTKKKPRKNVQCKRK